MWSGGEVGGGRSQLTDVADIITAGGAHHPLPGLTDAPHQAVLLQAGLSRRRPQPDPGLHPTLLPDPVITTGDVVASSPELTAVPSRTKSSFNLTICL